MTEGISRCEEIRREVAASPVAVAAILHPLAALRAMAGDLDEARRLLREGNAILDELGTLTAAVSHNEPVVEMLAGRPEVAEARLRGGYERLEAMGERAVLATTAALLARAIEAQGRDEEAERYCRVSRETAAPEDLPTQIMWRGTAARVLARRGLGGEATALARAAVELAEGTDLLTIRADAFLDLAEALDLAGQPEEADAADLPGDRAPRAQGLYGRRGASAGAARRDHVRDIVNRERR